jgi:hypothetical protein
MYFPSPLETKRFLTYGEIFHGWFFWIPVVITVNRNAIYRVLLDNASNYEPQACIAPGSLMASNNSRFQSQKEVVSSIFDKQKLGLLDNAISIFANTLLARSLLNSQGQGVARDAFSTFTEVKYLYLF